MKPSKSKPKGNTGATLIALGAVSFFLALATDGLRIFAETESNLRAALETGGFGFSRELGLWSASGALIGLAVCFGMVTMVLGSPGTLRRVMLGLTLVILVAMLLPVFAVWGIFWKPFSLFLGAVWALFSSLLYAARHAMPCEGEGEKSAKRASNVIHMTTTLPGKTEKRTKNGDGGR